MKLTIDLDDMVDIREGLELLQGLTEPKDAVADKPKSVFEEPDVIEAVEEHNVNEPVPQPSTLDKHGREWNGEIDSDPAKLTKEGEWRSRRKPKNLTTEEWKDFVQLRLNPPPAAQAEAVEEESSNAGNTGFENMLEAVTPPVNKFMDFKARVVKAALDEKQPDFTITNVNARCVKLGVANISELEGRDALIDILELEFF